MNKIPAEFIANNKPLTGEFEKKVLALSKRGKSVDEITNLLHRGVKPLYASRVGEFVTSDKSPTWHLLRNRIEKIVGGA